MTPLQRYIAEEIATDHADGLLSRREAMRRLALLGLGTAAATALIAACGDNKKPAPVTAPASGPTTTTTDSAPPPGMENAIQPAPITWDDGKLQGSWAAATEPRGAVLVIHENKGLNDWVRSVVGRLGGTGYSALGIDLLSAQGGTAAFKDPAEATAALGKTPPDQFVTDLRSGLDELARRAPGAKLAVVGFCFGGGLTWQLLAAGEPRLAAAVPFYGPLPDPHDFSGSKQAAVLAFYGAKDERVTSSKDAAAAALEQAGMVHQMVVEPDADHAFFNDTGPRYNGTAAADAWKQLQSWLDKYLA
ncbi:dienelactone hydrolase family protein [Mycobacterium sp. CBMA293]|uniref:dienelactone hydrolase family protein n=2 Tax=Mycolicibacterium TaxID=1866885 RepID=UPI001327B97D|nr:MULTISPECIES: dienelactone hydrolase family protein [unclassified Mycolicibacterium]MUL49111.1 dienelactone hydrolase family protein [Mycolicibacterium sp. CBMA 360]MUL97305.1 dienelactone hydrolase family protein [Mycolicibacterium sp. CBMA 230]MUL62660.1 dienelactone hydrolase family protein [Mycolicibacterium sp. CBMA 335]MUL69653.1 dienelactone hydrolase family protein [Mycolicibacterium sp. CBMA 311]MUM07935.1 dienelactone hydrolase [Mycolicibacterium sp. CBMA 213]